MSHFATTKWGDKHGFLQLLISNAKLCLAAGDKNLEYDRITKPELLNPNIEDDTKGQEILQLQEY